MTIQKLRQTATKAAPALQRYALPATLAICFLFNIIRCHIKPRILSMPAINYFVGYETGFGGRKLIGTLFGWMLPDYTTAASLIPITLTACLLISLLFITIVWKAIPVVNNSTLPLTALTIVYLLSPYGIFKWFIPELAPLFMETYQILLVLTWVLLFVKCRDNWLYWPATIIIAAAGCLIHHTFCCTVFPLMAALFAYDILRDNGINWKKTLYYGLVCTFILALFVAIWGFGGMNIDIDTLCQRLSKRIDPAIICDWDGRGLGKVTLEEFYYMTNAENHTMCAELLSKMRIDFIFTLLYLSPLVAALWYPWFSAVRHSSSNWERTRYILVSLAATALTVPIFFMATDYGRWWFCYFFLPIYAARSYVITWRQRD